MRSIARARVPTVVATAAAAVLLVAGCGSDKSTDPGGVLDPRGTGSGTLLVLAEIQGRDTDLATFETDFEVMVRDTLGAGVSGAVVEVVTPSGTVTVPEESPSSGVYRSTRNGYAAGSYEVRVTRGTDRVEGVRVRAPEIHTITSPSARDTVAANQSLAVTWTRIIPAEEAWLESRDYESPAAELDDGASSVPALGNPVRDDQRIRVHRQNRITAAGGLPGSHLEARIRNSIEPVIAR